MNYYDQNLKNLRKTIKELGADAAIVSMKSTFENSDDNNSDIMLISGFSGSNGRAIVSESSATLSVDGRYTSQALRQTDSSIWKIEMYPDIDTNKMIEQTMTRGETLAICPMSISYKSYLSIAKTASTLGVSLKAIDSLKIPRSRQISEVSLKMMNQCDMGESVASRISRVQENIGHEDGILVTDKVFIGWIFGIRRSVLTQDKSVLANCIAFIPKSGRPSLFCDLELLVDQEEFSLYKISDFAERLKNSDRKNVCVDYGNTPAYFVLALQSNGFKVKAFEKKYGNFESIKNDTEIANQKKAAELTSLAFIKTLAFVENTTNITEKDVASYFQTQFQSYERVVGFSFNPISAFGKNTAIVHYSPDVYEPARIANEGLFLFDAGIHFEYSTTDMTRTIYIGNNPSDELKRLYSAILKSVIMFTTAKFPDSTKASSIDAFARYHLWKESFDYNFGTGHGIGSFGNVHEPPRISQSSSDRITSNMVVTVEPGIYNMNFGIRLENMVVSQVDKNSNFLYFETLNYIPFCRKFISPNLFNTFELDWINNYHRQIYEKFYALLREETNALDWLIQNTEEII